MSVRLDDATLVDPAPEGPRVLEATSLLIEDGRIAAIGDPTASADEVIDARGGIVAPGLVNAHTHAAMTLLRGAADDLPLEPWLRERIWPAEAKLTPEAVRAGTELAIAEMLAGGITGFADMYFFEDQVAEAAQATGIRALAGFTVVDAGTPEHPAEALLDEAEAFLGRWPADGSPVQGTIAPHATYTCSAETLSRCAELAADHGAPLQTHCSETRHEVYTVEQATGHRPVDQLEATGCLTERALLAHCGWITKGEARRIGQSGAVPVHNPVANMKLATGGYMPVPELLEAGAPVALGTDGPASNNVLDMFQALKLAALLHDHHRWEAGAIDAATALRMATLHGHRAIGNTQGGRVEEGAIADLMLVDTGKPHLQPMTDPVSHLVYAARPDDVRTTLVGGQVLYHDGQHRTLELADVLARSRQAAAGLG